MRYERESEYVYAVNKLIGLYLQREFGVDSLIRLLMEERNKKPDRPWPQQPGQCLHPDECDKREKEDYISNLRV